MGQSTDVLKSVRVRIDDDQGRNIYVTVALEPGVGTPYEIWITMPDENKRSEQRIKTNMIMIAALFTEARESGAPYSKLFRAMERCCYDKTAVPAKLLEILKKVCPEQDAATLEFEAKARKEYGDTIDVSSERIEEIGRIIKE